MCFTLELRALKEQIFLKGLKQKILKFVMNMWIMSEGWRPEWITNWQTKLKLTQEDFFKIAFGDRGIMIGYW